MEGEEKAGAPEHSSAIPETEKELGHPSCF